MDGGRSSAKPRTANVSYAASMRSPASAARRKRSVSRMRATGFSRRAAFQPSTIASDEVPMPRAKRPGAASATAAASIASSAGPRA